MSEKKSAPKGSVAGVLSNAAKAAGFRQYAKWIAGAVVICLVVAGFVFFKADKKKAQSVQFRTETVTRGDLTVSVTATGKLQPTNQVDVGSEVSGTIRVVFVDDNDRVKKGQVLAELNTAVMEQRVIKSQAALDAARAAVLQAQATADESRANMARLRQVAELSGGKVPSKAELESAEAALKRAEATVLSAVAAVGQAEATLKSDETDLSKAIIRSPIDGIILSRKIEPGQTVAAAMQAPILFTIAENLAQMELEVAVDEADVGMVSAGQKATFRVTAWPNRKYSARVKRLAYGSTITENVVTYQALLTVDNSDLSLRPGMTANAEIVTAKRENVLLVPNPALRFVPPVAGQAMQKKGPDLAGALVPRLPAQAKKARITDKLGGEQTLHILVNGVPTPVTVTVGVTNGRLTEIISGEIEEGAKVIVESIGGRS